MDVGSCFQFINYLNIVFTDYKRIWQETKETKEFLGNLEKRKPFKKDQT